MKRQVTALVLAGGLARRMQAEGDATDKGLLRLRGAPLVAHVLARLAPQVDSILVNANRNLERYRAFGHPVVVDAVEGFAGPLAGLHAGLLAARSPWLMAVPCDSPFLPADLLDRLAAAAEASGAPIAFARAGSRSHPVFALVRTSLRENLESYLAGGGRRMEDWYASLGAVAADFPDPGAFRNINTPEELHAAESSDTCGACDARAAGPDDGSPGGIDALCRAVAAFDPRALPVASAQSIMASFIEPVRQVEDVPIREALERVLARDIVSPIDVPPHDNSAMDGFAVRGSDLDADGETRLAVIGRAAAGRPFDGRLGPGEAVRIMTGAVMPVGADTVVLQEAVRLADEETGAPQVIVPPGQQTGQNRRRRGEDLAAGRPALSEGKRLGPAELGLAASLGLATVPVRRRVRVAFFSTGDEILSLGEPPAPGKVYDSNRYALLGMLARLGVEPLDMGVVPDDPGALERAMTEAARTADAVISSGGVSVGEADFTRAVMARVGDVAFWSIAMRPGRPMAFGRVGSAYYFGLPGNPVAVMVTFCFFVRDALLRLMGAAPQPLPSFRARAASPVRKRPGRTEYQRAVLGIAADGVLEARITGSQSSAMLRSMSEADCMMVLGHDSGDVAAGDWVEVVPFHGLL
ncbi:MAG: molybdenum cofactor guanylyltransferase [Burkholderiaceae bacterium]|nr:molybdenum cofactor guanylyltransferase [Burkholderiaceae bacterium]